MKWHYDLCCGEPIIRDEWLNDGYGAAYISSVTMNVGALVGQGTADQAGTDACGREFTCKLSYNPTINSMATNVLGVLMETPYAVNTTAYSFLGTSNSTAGNVDLPTTAPTPPNQYHAQGVQSSYHGKVIINPGAVYLCQQKIDTSNAISVTRVSSTTVESVAAGLAGNYVYFANLNANASTGVKGSLRYLYQVSGTSGALSKTLTGTATTSDYYVVVYGRNTRAPALTADSTMVTCGTAAVTGGTTNLVIAETYIEADEGLAVLRPYSWGFRDNLHYVHGGASGTNYNAGPRFWYDLVMKSHLYGNSI